MTPREVTVAYRREIVEQLMAAFDRAGKTWPHPLGPLVDDIEKRLPLDQSTSANIIAACERVVRRIAA